MTRHFDVAIVGSGHGGAQAAITLRQKKFSGSIGIITAEHEPPYERPPLTKDYLAGERALERMLLRPKPFWEGNGIDLLRSRRVTGLLPGRRVLTLSNDTCVSYGKLIWAAGGRARKLDCPGSGLDGVCAIRTLDDCNELRRELESARKVVAIGGGYIGLEAAATLRKLGKDVTLIEASERLLSRTCDPVISDYLEQEHRRHGVAVRLATNVVSIKGHQGRVAGVTLEGGATLEADLVIVGIGLDPRIAELKAAGAQCANGILVDSHCRASLEHIYAIGDCAAFRNCWTRGDYARLESVQNAAGMARTAVQDILGGDESYEELPWFWSHQYDLKLQTIGWNAGYDRVVLRGEKSTGRFTLAYLKGGVVIALDCINQPADFVQGRKLIEARASVDPAKLADPAHSLKSMVPVLEEAGR
ncbi:FAD-dependent oxidoreductase [Erythrobacter sp.]|uniref:NAD(P)/FAD-dependent oxidoreductase n=1 Tax=Erythrobacter sp. TaxID=1042 RepID=UPI001B1918C0|nr:FAD-dependent oxidoreductase [Erythrobacter sp.]MBO6527548.1 FAD-dependent oxidoreductase [Erythrobacter sp.]MBO6530228.1 FAD-dependent oxidoreductase [Erythrobacter sp.]